jgi:hypothetical protein
MDSGSRQPSSAVADWFGGEVFGVAKNPSLSVLLLGSSFVRRRSGVNRLSGCAVLVIAAFAVAAARVPSKLVFLVLRWPLAMARWILVTAVIVQAVVPGAAVAAWLVLPLVLVIMVSTFGMAVTR